MRTQASHARTRLRPLNHVRGNLRELRPAPAQPRRPTMEGRQCSEAAVASARYGCTPQKSVRRAEVGCRRGSAHGIVYRAPCNPPDLSASIAARTLTARSRRGRAAPGRHCRSPMFAPRPGEAAQGRSAPAASRQKCRKAVSEPGCETGETSDAGGNAESPSPGSDVPGPAGTAGIGTRPGQIRIHGSADHCIRRWSGSCELAFRARWLYVTKLRLWAGNDMRSHGWQDQEARFDA